MADVKDYVIVLNTLVEDKKRLIGQLAIEKAKKIKGITINDDGVVLSIEMEPQEALGLMMRAYTDVLGQSAEETKN